MLSFPTSFPAVFMIDPINSKEASGLTLLDVITHLQQMERRLSERIEVNTRQINSNTFALFEFKISLLKSLGIFDEGFKPNREKPSSYRETVI